MSKQKPKRYQFQCRVCRRYFKEYLAPHPYCDCGLPLELADRRVPLREEVGQRTEIAADDVPALKHVLTEGMSREEILAAVAVRAAKARGRGPVN
jgi:hypothetical protein